MTLGFGTVKYLTQDTDLVIPNYTSISLKSWEVLPFTTVHYFKSLNSKKRALYCAITHRRPPPPQIKLVSEHDDIDWPDLLYDNETTTVNTLSVNTVWPWS